MDYLYWKPAHGLKAPPLWVLLARQSAVEYKRPAICAELGHADDPDRPEDWAAYREISAAAVSPATLQAGQAALDCCKTWLSTGDLRIRWYREERSWEAGTRTTLRRFSAAKSLCGYFNPGAKEEVWIRCNDDDWPAMVFGAVAHEARHRWQYDRDPAGVLGADVAAKEQHEWDCYAFQRSALRWITEIQEAS